MRRLYIQILIFVTPFLMLLLWVPLTERTKYTGLGDDCFYHAPWIYDRICSSEVPIDVAFFGSSRTINGIDDKTLSAIQDSSGINVVNLGYCRLGRDLTYVLIQRLLQNHHPKRIILEVREDENHRGHPIFPYLANKMELLSAPLNSDFSYFKNWYEAASYKIDRIQDIYRNQTAAAPTQTDLFGFRANADTAEALFLDSIKQKRQLPRKIASPAIRSIQLHHSRNYLKKIATLCASEGIELYFLYMPGFGYGLTEPLEKSTYETCGKLLYPPKDLFLNPDLWHDQDHTNTSGAVVLTSWISEQEDLFDGSK